MSAGNSADKPQFVENQMLTHDSLNNLVEFSAGRTQRVMKALGLGGTVSGVSWSFDTNNNQIIIEPGFIVFPDGEVAEIKETLYFNDVDEDMSLKSTKTPPPLSIQTNSQLTVSYEWVAKISSVDCFVEREKSHTIRLVWRIHTPSAPKSISFSAELFRPFLSPPRMSLKIPSNGVFPPIINNNTGNKIELNISMLIANLLNRQIDIYNTLVGTLNGEKLVWFMFSSIPRVTVLEGCGIGIYGDISFEIAYFSRRLMIALSGLLRYRDLRSGVPVVGAVNLGVANTFVQRSADIDSMLFEAFISNKVASESISRIIEKVNSSASGGWPEEIPRRIEAFRCNARISGVFLNSTAQVVANYCDAVVASDDDEFIYYKHDRWRGGLVGKWERSSDMPLHFVSSYLHKSDERLVLCDSVSENKIDLCFLRPYREW